MRPRSMLAVILVLLAPTLAAGAEAAERGSVIFLHPDGTGVNHWGALRFLKVGPDGRLEWDKLEGLAVYTGHMKDALTSTSHGGATVHAYGVKVAADSFGRDGTEEITAASGAGMSIMQEARAAGMAVGVVQTGHIAEPGTAAFLASVPLRKDHDEVARQVIESGAQVIMAGGEKYLLPKDANGRHGPGRREDGADLVRRARDLGYTVVYTRHELKALDLAKTDKLLGVFAHQDTFNARPEQENAGDGKPHYMPDAPTIAEMSRAALAILSRASKGFFLVAEEEGTDNMANDNNAAGTLEALSRADDAVGVLRDFVREDAKTLLLMAADSDAGGMQVLSPGPRRDVNGGISPPKLGGMPFGIGKPLAPADENGAPLDGAAGTGSVPFVSAPDKAGRRWPFAIAWATRDDASGGILVRGTGLNSDRIAGTMDNTDVYKLMYLTLFGREIP